MYSKLIKNTTFYTFASLFPQLLNFLLLPLYTHYLSPTEYGAIALVQVYSLILVIFGGFALHSSIGRFYVEYINDEVRRKKFISSLFFLLLIACALFLFLVDINGQRLISFLYSESNINYSPYFRIATWTALFTILIQLFSAILRIEEKAKHFFIVSAIYAFLTTIFVIFGVVIFKMGILGYLLALLISHFLSFFLYFYLTRNNFVLSFDFSLLRGPLKYSLPLLPHALSGYIFMYSDRIILEKYVSVAAIGVYALADQIARVFKMGVDSFNNAYSPHFLKTAHFDKSLAAEQSTTLAEFSVFILCLFIVLLSIFLPELSRFLIDQRYYAIWMMVPILASSFIFRSLYCFSSGGLFFEKKTLKVFLITLASAAVNIILNLIFIPIYGVMVAVITSFISYFSLAVTSYLLSKETFVTVMRYKKIIYCLFIFFATLLFSYFINFNSHNFNFGIILVLKSLLLICYLFIMSKFLDYRTLIWNLVNFLKSDLLRKQVK